MHQPGNLSIDSEHHYFWHVITLPTTIHFLNQLLIKALLTKSLRKLHQNCTLPTNKNKFKKINKRNNSFVYLKALKNLWKQIFYIVWFQKINFCKLSFPSPFSTVYHMRQNGWIKVSQTDVAKLHHQFQEEKQKQKSSLCHSITLHVLNDIVNKICVIVFKVSNSA